MTAFAQLTTTRRGTVGEDIAKAFFVRRGCVPFGPAVDGSHPIDLTLLTPKGDLVLVDVKTYPRRYVRPETGIDQPDWQTYQHLAMRNPGIVVYLLFVDAFERAMYGGRVEELSSCARPEGGKVYFPLGALQHVSCLSAEEVRRIGPPKDATRYRHVTPYYINPTTP